MPGSLRRKRLSILRAKDLASFTAKPLDWRRRYIAKQTFARLWRSATNSSLSGKTTESPGSEDSAAKGESSTLQVSSLGVDTGGAAVTSGFETGTVGAVGTDTGATCMPTKFSNVQVSCRFLILSTTLRISRAAFLCASGTTARKALSWRPKHGRSVEGRSA